MSKQIIILSCEEEFHFLKKKMKLRNPIYITIGSRFNQNFYRDNNVEFYDDYINRNDKEVIQKNSDFFLWNWFIDKKNNDISKKLNCSLGIVFSSNIESLINLSQKYFFFLKKILKEENEIYINKFSDVLLINLIEILKKNKKFKLVYFEKKIKKNYIGGKRNLDNLFENFKLINLFYKSFKNLFSVKINKKIFFLPGGKMNHFFSDCKDFKDVKWYIPLIKNRKIFFKKNIEFYYYFQSKQQYIENVFYENLINNISQFNFLPKEHLIFIFKKFIFCNFNKIINYYIYLTNFFNKNKINIVLIGGELYEHFITAAIAAKKCNITSIFMPHSLNLEGYEILKNKYKIFDKFVSFGSIDNENYYKQNIRDNKIINLPFPHYCNFLEKKKFSNVSNYRTALILTPDRFTRYVDEKLSKENLIYDEILKVLYSLNIEVNYIKGKNIDEFFRVGKFKKHIFNGKKIDLVDSYGELSNYLNKVDLVIGPPSTAAIECLLLNRDYYIFQKNMYENYSSSFLTGYKSIFRVSHDMNELKLNIIKKNFLQNRIDKKKIIYFHDYNKKNINLSYINKKLSELIESNEQ